MQILRNGKMLFSMPGANALAVDRGYILAAGSDEEILNLATAETPQIDLNGLSVLPGLTDAHIHLELYGESLQIENCDTPTRAACIERIRQKAISTSGSAWIKGHGWNQNHWSEGYGTALELDQVSGNHPVFLTDVSLHSAWVNSQALQIAGISASTPDPEGGRIQRDVRNNPTGMLFENAVALVESKIPPTTPDQRKQNLYAAQQKLLEFGITSVHDFDRMPCFQTLQELDEEKDLLLRVVKNLPVDQLPAIIEAGLRPGFGSDHLRIGSIKCFADGALGPQTAAMLEPYELDSANRGTLLLTAAEILETGIQAAVNGFSLAVHAIGDRATQEVLHGFDLLRKYETEHGLTHPRHRIEHLQLLHPANLGRAAALRITASMQPVHLYNDMETANRHWGSRCRYAFPLASLLSNGTKLIFGSDAPVESPNPFWGIHAAVARCSRGKDPSEAAWIPKERITVMEALQGYVHVPHWQAGQDHTLGRLEAGYKADLVVLDHDPLTFPIDQLHLIRPCGVMVDGKWVYHNW